MTNGSGLEARRRELEQLAQMGGTFVRSTQWLDAQAQGLLKRLVAPVAYNALGPMMRASFGLTGPEMHQVIVHALKRDWLAARKDVSGKIYYVKPAWGPEDASRLATTAAAVLELLEEPLSFDALVLAYRQRGGTEAAPVVQQALSKLQIDGDVEEDRPHRTRTLYQWSPFYRARARQERERRDVQAGILPKAGPPTRIVEPFVPSRAPDDDEEPEEDLVDLMAASDPEKVGKRSVLDGAPAEDEEVVRPDPSDLFESGMAEGVMPLAGFVDGPSRVLVGSEEADPTPFGHGPASAAGALAGPSASPTVASASPAARAPRPRRTRATASMPTTVPAPPEPEQEPEDEPEDEEPARPLPPFPRPPSTRPGPPSSVPPAPSPTPVGGLEAALEHLAALPEADARQLCEAAIEYGRARRAMREAEARFRRTVASHGR